MHQSSPCVGILLQEGLLFSTLQLSFISFLLFLLKTLSEWERLSSDNSQLSTHLSIHPFIHLLPVSTFLYIKESLIRCYCCIPFDPSQMQCRNAFMSCTLLHVCFVLCPSPPLGCLPLSPSASHIYPQHDKMAICLVIHLQTPFPPERSISFSSFPPEKALLPDFSFISLSQIFHLSLLYPFHNISLPAI